MLSNKKVLFIGGDARQLEMINFFVRMNLSVNLIGYNNLQTPISGTNAVDLGIRAFNQADILILPVMGTDDQGKINTIFAADNLVLTDEHIAAMPKGSYIFVGLANSYLKGICSKYDINLFELMERDDVAIYNSIPTVEGALMMAVHNTDITIHGSKCTVLGLGRVGMSMARTLNAIGANTSVGVRKDKDVARAVEMGLEVFRLADLADVIPETQILFNTIPMMIVTKEILMAMNHDAFILDLASKPGGVDYDFAEKRGIKAILAPGLPGIVAPKTAGKILSEAIVSILKSN